MRYLTLIIGLLSFTACGSEAEPTETDTSPADAADTSADAADTEEADATEEGDADAEEVDADAVLTDVSDVGEPQSCGPLTCTATEVCIVRCICCGIDTGNPADQQTDYECVAPPDSCEGRPSECVEELDENRGCYPSNDWLLECLCA